MKKLLWVLTVLCVLLAGCSPKSTSARATAEDDIVNSAIVINDSEKEVTVSVGMPYETIAADFSSSLFDAYRAAFLKAQNGELVLVSFDYYLDQHRVFKIEILPSHDQLPSVTEFEQIKKGMTLSEVTALLGVPYAIPELSGLYCYQYLLDDGTIRSVCWNVIGRSMTVMS